MDALAAEERGPLETIAARREQVFPISAIDGTGIENLIGSVALLLDEERHEAAVSLEFDQGRARAWLYEQGVVQDERQTDDGMTLKVRWTARQARRFAEISLAETR